MVTKRNSRSHCPDVGVDDYFADGGKITSGNHPPFGEEDAYVDINKLLRDGT